MKQLIPFIILWILAGSLIYCCKKDCPPATNISPVISKVPDTVTPYFTYKDDVPPPPSTSWRNIDTTNFSYCEQRIWKYVQHIYPINDTNYYSYKLYSLSNEQGDIWQRRENVRQFIYFFLDTIYKLPDPQITCGEVSRDFFLNSIGEPTCTSTNQVEKIYTYFYSFKLRDRCGPCTQTWEDQPFDQRCDPEHFKYCGLLKITFSQQTNKMLKILFFGPSC